MHTGKGVQLLIEEFKKSEHEYTGWGCRAGSPFIVKAAPEPVPGAVTR
ncbi:MAG: hypothetical protein ACOY3U_01615 [Bacillota bacterium]|nr:hypothetical protein [Desulforamulus profundi]